MTYGHEGGDLLTVLDELDTDTLPDGGVGLLGLNTDLLEDDALGVRRTTSWRGLVEVTKRTLLVRLVRLLNASPETQRSAESAWRGICRGRGLTQRLMRRSVRSFRAACNPRGLLAEQHDSQ